MGVNCTNCNKCKDADFQKNQISLKYVRSKISVKHNEKKSIIKIVFQKNF